MISTPISPKDTRTRAQQNRAVRQEALREQLSAQGHVQHVVDLAAKFSDATENIDAAMLTRYKAAADIHLALIKKYLPDLKATEITGPEGGDVIIQIPALHGKF